MDKLKNLLQNALHSRNNDYELKNELFLEFQNSTDAEYWKQGWRQLQVYYKAKRFLEGVKRSNRGIPTRYLFATQMKSGTKHLEACAREIYKLERYTPIYTHSDARLSADLIRPVFFNESDFLCGESFLSFHLRPSKQIVNYIQLYSLPTLVLLRNPIQALVSHFYYILKHNFNKDNDICLSPGQYFGSYKIKSNDDLKNFLIDIVFKKDCKFIYEWESVRKKITQDNNVKSTILYHETLSRYPESFHQQLHEFLDINLGLSYDKIDFSNITNHNMRKGSTNEWKSFFSNSEKDRMLKIVDPILKHFSHLSDIWEIG